MQDSLAGWWFRTWILFFHILGMSSSQLTNSYFQRGGLNHQPVVILPYVSWLDGTIVQLHRQCPSRGAQPISKWSYTKFASHFKAVLHYVSLILNHAHHHGQNYSMIAAVTFFWFFFFSHLWSLTANSRRCLSMICCKEMHSSPSRNIWKKNERRRWETLRQQVTGLS